MNNEIKCVLTATVFVLAGCAMSPKLTSAETAELHAPLTCKDEKECTLFWQRAQVWLVSNSKYKIQTTTDTVITTYGPMANDPGLAYTITKVPDGNGGAQIVVNNACANIFGCQPGRENAALSFKRYVAGKNTVPAIDIPRTSNWRPVNQ